MKLINVAKQSGMREMCMDKILGFNLHTENEYFTFVEGDREK